MSHQNRYPSPGPGDQPHPYHQSPQVTPDVPSNIQPAAPTALMQETPQNGHDASQNFQSFLANYNAQPATPQQVAQQSLEVNGTGQGAGTDPAKKRNKVSRACDECRRKKVRCDAETDQTGTQCSNCKRTSSTCQFSRQPQKRGPSKGYIKELAERVSRLEYTPQSSELPFAIQNNDAQQFSPQVDFQTPSNQRKRTHSVSEGQGYGMSAADQLQEYARANAATHGVVFPGASSTVLQPPTHHGLPIPSEEYSEGVSAGPLSTYYRNIHPTFPLLPETESQLSSNLEAVPPDVRQAFNSALATAAKAATSGAYPADIKNASDQYNAIKKGRASGHTVELVRLQTLTLLALIDELDGPATSKEGAWLGAAIAKANAQHLSRSSAAEDGQMSPLLRRVWLTLILLDRWHAASIIGATLISDDDVNIDESDHALLGSSSYHFLRTTITLGHFTNIFLHHSSDISSPTSLSRPIITLLKGELARLRESIEPLSSQLPTITFPLLLLRLFTETTVQRYYSDGPVLDIIASALSSLTDDEEKNVPSLLTQQYVSFLVATLAGVSVEGEERGEWVRQGLERLRDVVEKRVVPGWRASLGGLVGKVLDRGIEGRRGGLEGLAEAAVGGSGNKTKERSRGHQVEGDGVEEMQWAEVLENGWLQWLL